MMRPALAGAAIGAQPLRRRCKGDRVGTGYVFLQLPSFDPCCLSSREFLSLYGIEHAEFVGAPKAFERAAIRPTRPREMRHTCALTATVRRDSDPFSYRAIIFGGYGESVVHTLQ
jgi:hypothetical protein